MRLFLLIIDGNNFSFQNFLEFFRFVFRWKSLIKNVILSETSPSTLANGNETLSESQPERFQLKSCINGTKWCGLEAACIEEGDSIKCVCPHDKSAPTKDLKCTNRAVGKMLKIILNIFFFSYNLNYNYFVQFKKAYFSLLNRF